MNGNNQIQGLKAQLDQYQNNNIRRIMDLQKLRKCLNRLRNDLYVFKLSKKLQKESQIKAQVQTEKEASFQEDDELAKANSSNPDVQNESKGSGSAANIVDSDNMVSEQIQQTMEAISKMEASLTTELITQESKDRSKARRSAGNSPVAVRSRSQIIDTIRIDSTMVTELEYLNMMPTGLSKIDESSFLKGMQNTT